VRLVLVRRLFYCFPGPWSRRNRDNGTAIELFLAGARGWEAGVQRRVDDVKSNDT
jgi:hypothetical protein